MILEKKRSCLYILEPGYWTYDWACFVGPIGPNAVSRPQAPRSRSFLRFHDFFIFLMILEKIRFCL